MYSGETVKPWLKRGVVEGRYRDLVLQLRPVIYSGGKNGRNTICVVSPLIFLLWQRWTPTMRSPISFFPLHVYFCRENFSGTAWLGEWNAVLWEALWPFYACDIFLRQERESCAGNDENSNQNLIDNYHAFCCLFSDRIFCSWITPCLTHTSSGNWI